MVEDIHDEKLLSMSAILRPLLDATSAQQVRGLRRRERPAARPTSSHLLGGGGYRKLQG